MDASRDTWAGGDQASAAAVPDERVVVRGPASLSNLGPGYDAIGLCLSEVGDVVEAWRTDADAIRIVPGKGAGSQQMPLEPQENTAAVAAQSVLRQAGVPFGVALRISKGITVGSGVGSSAASAVAGAWAANLLLEEPFSKEELVRAVLEGERVASGSLHGDNVLPALLGGLVLVSASDPTDYRSVELPGDLPIALIQPDLEVLTRKARAMLPDKVPLKDAVHNASALARMIDAFHVGDWEAVGELIMQDRLVEPVRATLVPCYGDVRHAALDAGALGCALSGSGPAMFAITETEEGAEPVLEAMMTACQQLDIDVTGCVTSADATGACALEAE